MSRIDKSIFIQNIEETTTVLQQLRVCIEQIKEIIDRYVEDSELQSEVQRATARENQIAGNLASEIERATAKENEIVDDLDDEVTRATGAEDTLSDRIDVLEGEIAYVELPDNMSGTLTNEQYANILKPNCVIKCFERYFTRAVREGVEIVYGSHTSIDDQSQFSYLEYMEIRITTTNKNYVLFGGSRDFYLKSQTDTLLAGKQGALEFNPAIPSGTTPTQLTNLKDGENYYSLGGGNEHLHIISVRTRNDGIIVGLVFKSSKSDNYTMSELIRFLLELDLNADFFKILPSYCKVASTNSFRISTVTYASRNIGSVKYNITAQYLDDNNVYQTISASALDASSVILNQITL